MVAVIEANLDAHRDVCFGLDQTIWPEQVPQTILYLKVTTDGLWVWMLRDPERELTIRADPTFTADQMANVRAMVEKAEAANPGRTKALYIAMKGTATPRPGAPWLPVSETLKPQELTFGPKPNYKWLDVKDPLQDPSLFD